MTPPTPPPAAPGAMQHTPTPWFVHEYYPQKQSEPLYSIGSDEHTAADGSHIAIASHICKAEDARAIVECVNSHAALVAEVEGLRKRLEWMPADAAPMDCERVLAAFTGVHGPTLGFIANSRFYPDGGSGSIPITHWMPCPALPDGKALLAGKDGA